MQQQQQRRLRHRNWMAPTPSEAHSEQKRRAGHGPADPEDRWSDVAFRQDWVDHTAADACLSASRQRTWMMMMTMTEQV